MAEDYLVMSTTMTQSTLTPPLDMAPVSVPFPGRFTTLRHGGMELRLGSGCPVPTRGTSFRPAGTLSSALSRLTNCVESSSSAEVDFSPAAETASVRFHLTDRDTENDESATSENGETVWSDVNALLLVRLFWRGSTEAIPDGLSEWTLANSRIRGRLVGIADEEVHLVLETEVPAGSLLTLRVIEAAGGEFDLRGRTTSCVARSDGGWTISCRLTAPVPREHLRRLTAK